jgi:LAS superfamily LD-carboxypeptidase LdcB
VLVTPFRFFCYIRVASRWGNADLPGSEWEGKLDNRRVSAPLRRVFVAAVGIVFVIALLPSAGDARPAAPAAPARPRQEDPGGSGGGDAGGGDARAVIDIDVDVATDDSAAVTGALDDLERNVKSQLLDLRAAENEVATAQGNLDLAEAAVDETEGRLDALLAESDGVVVDVFMNPPDIDSLDTMASDTITDATVKQALLDMQADDDAAVLAELEQTRVQLVTDKEARSEARDAAEVQKAEREAELSDLEAATSQQADFIAEVSDRLDRNLSEADALARLDPAMAERLRAQQSELAAKLKEIQDTEAFQEAVAVLREAQRQAEEEAAAAAAAAPPELGAPSGSLAQVACPGGGSITVDSSIEATLGAMLTAAANDGVMLCGGGYRNPQEQIELRRANCGNTEYLIYEAPSSACSPPTARPGSSQHELGLAIDFTCNGNGVISGHSSPCFVWLDANASGYGFYNLPSEAWHWSTTGD